MYKPETLDQLITDSSNLLNFLKQHQIPVDDGYHVIDLISKLNEYYPNFDINEKIEGPKYEDFIYDVYKMNGIEHNFNKNDITLPYMSCNIRHGAYNSIIGMMSEYISLKVVLDKFKSGVINQSKNNQLRGEDITYFDNGYKITADVKTSRVDYTDIESVTAKLDWFKSNKSSVRMHLVDVDKNYHYITSRSSLHLMFDRVGDVVNVSDLQKYKHFYKHDISYITKSFLPQ